MKKTNQLFLGLFILLLSFNVHAQSKSGGDYFTGKWNILVKGLPDGDTKMSVNLAKTDTSYAGALNDSTGKEIAKFSKVEMKDTTVTVYFTAQGYDVYLRLNRKDDDHVSGTMLDMFDAEGDRVKIK
ncbi:MAG TPA: hypothetical protein VMI12_14730 [Puia sp.]|nr:hypothetical protein [Puia sp.]